MLFAKNHVQLCKKNAPSIQYIAFHMLDIAQDWKLTSYWRILLVFVIFLLFLSVLAGQPLLIRLWQQNRFELSFFHILGVAVHHFDEAHLPHWLPRSRVPFRRQWIWYCVKRSGKPGFLLFIHLPFQKRKVNQNWFVLLIPLRSK